MGPKEDYIADLGCAETIRNSSPTASRMRVSLKQAYPGIISACSRRSISRFTQAQMSGEFIA